MKKIISILLVCIVCLSVFLVPIFAQETVSEYTDEEKEFIYWEYIDNQRIMGAFFEDESDIGYWSTVNGIERNGGLKGAINLASYLIGEYPDEQKCAEILANLITMQSGNIAEQVQNQSQYDDLKNGLDYTMDVVDIAKTFMGGEGLFENVESIIDAATDGVEVVIDSVEQAKYYETSIRDYSQSKLFLQAVADYAKNDNLRKSAVSLLEANDKLLEKRLEYLTNLTTTLSEYEAKFFMENMSVDLLKTTDLYQTDETVKWYVDCGETLSNSIEAIFAPGTFAFKMTMLAGNIGFGTSNMFNRYQEMKIVADVAGAIVEANSQITISQDMDSALQDIPMKCDYYKMLIAVHVRGEYLLYQLLVNDAGILSDISVLFDQFKDPDDTTDSWYAKQIKCLTDYANILDEMFKLPDDDEMHAENAEESVDSKEVLQEESAYEQKYVLKSVTDYDSQGNVTGESEYQYDELGNNVAIIRDVYPEYHTDATYGIRMHEEMEYDENGKILKGIAYYEDSEIYSSYNYTYNQYGNKDICCSENPSSLEDNRVETKFIYDEKQILTTLEHYHYRNGSLEEMTRTNYEYDMQGNMIKESSYNSDGSLNFLIQYEYDHVGNVIKATGYFGNTGLMSWWEEYEYDYIQVLKKNSSQNMNEESLSESDIVDAMY